MDYKIPEPKVGDWIISALGFWGVVDTIRDSQAHIKDQGDFSLYVDLPAIRLILRGPMGQLGIGSLKKPEVKA